MILNGGRNLNLIDTGSKGELRKFGIVAGIILLTIGILPLIDGNPVRLYFVIPAFLFGITALSKPRLLMPIYKRWMKIAQKIGELNSFVILSIVYYLLVVPIGISAKLFGKNSGTFRFKQGKETYWIKRDPVDIKVSMKRTF